MSNQCLWCGGDYHESMDGICRECWEKHQFAAVDLLLQSPTYAEDMKEFDEILDKKDGAY